MRALQFTIAAQKAVDMLNHASYLNDTKRKYTAAARLIAEVEGIEGFEWIEDHDQRAEDDHNYQTMIGQSLRL